MSFDPRLAMLARVSERELSDFVHATAERGGWRIQRFFNSQRSNPGWPDFVLLRRCSDGVELVALELKTMTGRTRPGQVDCLDLLDDVVRSEGRLARPSDADWIRTRLLTKPR